MRTVLIAALASVSSLVLATEALAETVNTQATIAIPNANVDAGLRPDSNRHSSRCRAPSCSPRAEPASVRWVH